MLSFFSNIKHIIREKLRHKNLIKRSKQYQIVVMGSDIINYDENDTPPETDMSSSPRETPPPSPPPSTPEKIHTFFKTEITDTILKSDYELQSLMTVMKHSNIDTTDLVLEPRFEELIQKIPDATDILKIKMRILYIIIACDIYWNLFEEKKKYSTLKTKCFLGVYRYNDYIIRIDDSPYSFMNEKDVVNALSLSTTRNNIVLPFLVYTNIKRDIKNNICDCNKIVCACQYMDAADQHENMSEISETARSYFYKLRINTISFSIQHYVKNTEQLYNWIKDNIGNYVYNQFSNIQYPFFIDLFLKCSMLVRDLHEANIVHGDIKPDNILIKEHDDFDLNHHKKCKNFTVYLIDYGLSGIKNDGYGTGGTIPYCHPEFKNIRDINRSSKYNWKSQQLKHDVWSLGIIFITLYIYRDFYNYYYKYPNYFFTKDGYVSSLILDVISHDKLHDLFTKMLSAECSSIDEVCELLKEMVIH
jgi:hypothetical protein